MTISNLLVWIGTHPTVLGADLARVLHYIATHAAQVLSWLQYMNLLDVIHQIVIHL